MADFGGKMPLEEFSKTVPPGWQPHMPNYPFRQFIETLRLWYRITDYQPEQIGPVVTGRLRGGARTLANKLQCTDQAGNVHRGDAALAMPAQAAFTDHLGNVTPAVESGFNQLIRRLQTAY